MIAGVLAAGDRLLDRVELSAADDQVWPMLIGQITPADWSGDASAEAVVLVETSTVCSAIAAADAAVKVAEVIVRDVRLAIDLAGKAYFSMTGSLDSVQAAAEAATSAAAQNLVEIEVIAQPSPDLRGFLFR